VVLAGGRARRFGGVDKAALVVGGRTLLDVVLGACAGASALVVVGPRRPTAYPVRWEREEPVHGGPVAALAAGLRVVPAGTGVVAVLAADLPNLTTATLARLHAALEADADARPADSPAADGERSGDRRAAGAVLVDGDGRVQWLCGVWRVDALVTALAGAGGPAGLSVRGVLGPLRPSTVEALPGEAHDVDAADDL
jgi:molybdopterin-guanine dinucleotide biosynthesis protein A